MEITNVDLQLVNLYFCWNNNRFGYEYALSILREIRHLQRYRQKLLSILNTPEEPPQV